MCTPPLPITHEAAIPGRKQLAIVPVTDTDWGSTDGR